VFLKAVEASLSVVLNHGMGLAILCCFYIMAYALGSLHDESLPDVVRIK
jgi:hypothetical protein